MANELQKISEYYDRRTALDMDYRNYMEKQVEVGANITSSLDKMQGSIAQMQTGIQTSINNQTFTVVASQKALAHNFNQGFNQINNTLYMGFSGVSNQLGRMTESFNMGFARVENALDRMSDIMSTPLFTAFKELYCRAAERYRKGLFEEALEDTQAALEKDRTDPTAWFLQGKIYAFGASEDCNIIDLDKSIDALTKAAKYNKPNIADSYGARKMSAEIYFYLGLAQYSKSNDLLRENKNAESSEMLKKAQSSFEQSYQYSNDMIESLFNIARCKVIQGEVNGAISDLETLVLRERNYCLKVYDDNDFSSIFEQFTNLINKLKSIAFIPAKEDYDSINNMLSELKSLGGTTEESIPASFTEVFPYFDILDYAEDFKRIIPIVYNAIAARKAYIAKAIADEEAQELAIAEAKAEAEKKEKAARAEAAAKAKAEAEKEAERKRQDKAKAIAKLIIGCSIIFLALWLIGCYEFLSDYFFFDVPWYYPILIFYIPFTTAMIIIAILMKKNNIGEYYYYNETYAIISICTGLFYSIIPIIIIVSKGGGIISSITTCLVAVFLGLSIGFRCAD